MESDKKCQVVELLGRAPCAADGTLVIGRGEPGAHPKMSCSFCSGQKGKGRLPPKSTNQQAKAEAYAAFTRLVELPTFQQATRARVVGMMALRRFALHSIEPEFLNIQTSPLASWSVRSLKSSIRELRIAAGYVNSIHHAIGCLELVLTSYPRRTLPLFLRDVEMTLISTKAPRQRIIDVVGTTSQNMANIIPFLKATSDTSPSHLQETCIMAWGQLGR